MKLSQKETNILAILVFIIVCAMASCTKSNDGPAPASSTTTVKFYSSRVGVNSDGVTIAINGKNVGGLLYSAGAPDCSNNGFATTRLAAGAYKVDYYPLSSPGTATKSVSITVTASTTCQTFDLK
jgi:hypothetical protein